MASSGFTPNKGFFDRILRAPGVEALVDQAAERALGAARIDAPVKTGAYLAGLHIEHHDSRYRRVADVVGSDPKTMLVESRTGNLARSLKKAKK